MAGRFRVKCKAACPESKPSQAHSVRQLPRKGELARRKA